MKITKRILSILLCGAMALSMAGCGEKECDHEWLDATCEEPKTCEECDETKGEALGHTWVEATCETPKTCSVCNATEGDALGHTWKDADCENPKTCSVCKATEGDVVHDWKEATCESPKTCSICNTTSGEALGHTWIDATCKIPKTCDVCKTTEGVALGHVWEDADCSKPKTCRTCGDEEGLPLGHTWIDATYDNPKTCKICKKTEGKPLEKPPVTITFKDTFPSSYSYYDWNDKKDDTVKVTEVTYTCEKNWDDTYDISLYFSGEKTYDRDGNNVSDSCQISYKIYDIEGYVIDDGTYYTPALKVGDKFRKDEESLWLVDFTMGEYIIDFQDTTW